MINLEIKVQVDDLDAVRQRAEAMDARFETLLEQEDTFYAVPKGLLKLRVISGARAELISYDRPARSGSKISDYLVCPVEDPALLDAVLSRNLKKLGVVRKRRELWMFGGTRIHLDTVEGLGTFVELETEGNTRDEAATQAEHREVLQALALDPAHSLPQPYAALLFPFDVATEVSADGATSRRST